MLALARLKSFTYWNFLVLAAWGREEWPKQRRDWVRVGWEVFAFSIATWTCRMWMTGRFVPTAAMEGWCKLILFLVLCSFSWMMCGPILASTLILITGAHTAKCPMLCRHPSLLHPKGWRPHFDDDKLKCSSCNSDVLPQAVPCFFEQVLPHTHNHIPIYGGQIRKDHLEAEMSHQWILSKYCCWKNAIVKCRKCPRQKRQLCKIELDSEYWCQKKTTIWYTKSNGTALSTIS